MGARLEIVVTVAPPPHRWPDGRPRAVGLRGRLADLAYKLFTPTVDRPHVDNFGVLDDRLWRGAQPGPRGFARLRELGVDTVINLRAESDEEAREVRALGMNYLYFPLDPLAPPTHAQILAFLRAASDPSLGRVFFHCYHGADRTGVAAACWRIAYDGWTLSEAVREMRDFRFHQSFQHQNLAYVATFAAFWRGMGEARREALLRAEEPALALGRA
jgi:protein tyrosine/serine phosphatase